VTAAGTVSWAILAVAGLAVGILVGLVFFGGLWWTSQRLATARRPGFLVATSLLVRMIVIAATLVVLARVDVVMLAGGVIGVVVARMVLTRAAMNDRFSGPHRPPDTARDDSEARG
jgi:F1F0 ATPase subunit 2